MQDKMTWFRDAKYGLFIHWGLYSALGGLWNGVQYPKNTEWIMRYGQIPVEEYRKIADSFNPVDFDAEAWVQKAKDFGAKYLCFTAKHHDGFAMYDSKVSGYNIMHTPFGRDVVKELSQACKRHGIVFCLYYSQMQDWEDPNGYGNFWDFDPESKHFETYFYGKCLPQVRELLENYGEIGMLWFDTPYDMPRALCRRLREHVHAIQPNCIINGRIGYGLGDYRQMADNEIPVLAYPGDWETPMTLNNTWGYSRTDENWKTPETVLKMLIDVAGKGGNLLINIGPDGWGKIPQGSVDILSRVGAWLDTNGRSIYGTKASPDFPYQMRWGGVTAGERKLYLHLLTAKENPTGILLSGIETKATGARLLKDGTPLKMTQSYEIARDEYRLKVVIPPEAQDALDTVAEVEFEDEIRIHSLVMQFGEEA